MLQFHRQDQRLLPASAAPGLRGRVTPIKQLQMELLKGAAPCHGAGFRQEGVLGAGCAGGTVLGSRLSCAHSTYGGVGRGPGGQTHLCICFIRKIRLWGLCGGGQLVSPACTCAGTEPEVREETWVRAGCCHPDSTAGLSGRTNTVSSLFC